MVHKIVAECLRPGVSLQLQARGRTHQTKNRKPVRIKCRMESVAGARNCGGCTCTSNINTRFQCACKNATPTISKARVPVLRGPGGGVAARRVYYEARVPAVPDRDRYAPWQVPVARNGARAERRDEIDNL